MTYRPASATLTWPNGTVALIISPRNIKYVRGLSVAFALVVDWPSETDWAHVELAVRVGQTQIVAIDRPPASWSHVPGGEAR